MTIFDAGAKVGQAAIGLHSDGPGMAVREHHEDTATSMLGLGRASSTSPALRAMNRGGSPAAACRNIETYFFYLQRICNHRTYPGCLAACPRKAI